jgi:NADPH:quinone reductase-like Zn-dependent oxidoreductase
VTDAQAAALPVNYLTAWLALHKAANVAKDETVLIHGVGGGVGVAALQLALRRGAEVLGTASPSKHDHLRLLGVHHLIDRRRAGEDLRREVARLTGGRGVDIVLDAVGGRSFGTSYRLLAPLGRLVIYGVSAVAPGLRRRWWHAARTLLQMRSFKPMSLMNRNRGVFGLNLAHLWDERDRLSAAMEEILADVEQQRISPVVARTFALGAAADAHRFLQSRSNLGKVLLTAAPSS